MRIGVPLANAAAAALLPRREARAVRPEPAREGTTTAAPAVRSDLPGPVADRLDWLMAADPALAQAINAQLPAARQTSARDLAVYMATSRPRVDVSG